MTTTIKIIQGLSRAQWPNVFDRPVIHRNIKEAVTAILNDVKENGDDALIKLTERFDGVVLDQIASSVSKNVQISQGLEAAINQAIENITKYHEAQKRPIIEIETMQGIECQQINRPIGKVGFYIPGGTAPLLSTLMMLAIPAKIAGCAEMIICTPPNSDGSIHPAIEFIANKMNIQNIYRVGGAQAIGAMAYGTKSVPKVHKIFGPGNSFVTIAKEMIQAEGVAIDMPAGPSELMVYADETAIPSFVAADLLSQAEHGADSQVICITPTTSIANSIAKAVEDQLKTLPRRDIARKALAHSSIIVEPVKQSRIELFNAYAPEHLILACTDPESLLPDIQNAGSVFLGNWSAEAIGDYAAGPNHTLPTNGHAKAYSGITLDSFLKKMSVQKVKVEGFSAIANTVEQLAEAEDLIAHKRAVSIRKEYLKNG